MDEARRMPTIASSVSRHQRRKTTFELHAYESTYPSSQIGQDAVPPTTPPPSSLGSSGFPQAGREQTSYPQRHHYAPSNPEHFRVGRDTGSIPPTVSNVTPEAFPTRPVWCASEWQEFSPIYPRRIPFNTIEQNVGLRAGTVHSRLQSVNDGPDPPGSSASAQTQEPSPPRSDVYQQLFALNDVYTRSAFPSTGQRVDLGRRLALSPRNIHIWCVWHAYTARYKQIS